MSRNRLFLPLLVVTATTAGGIAYAQQSSGEGNDAVTDSAKAGVSIAQAIGAAEAQTSGKATRAELDSDRGKVLYEVEVVTADNKVVDVTVDANSGKVLSTRADAADRASDEEDKD